MEVTELKRRGRPPAMSREERRRRIVAAAEDTFTSKGYSAASMDDVVQACGMSKKTVYEMFDTKERLFRELVVSSLERAPQLDLKGMDHLGGRALMVEILREMAAFILSPRQMGLTKLVLTESQSSPELSAIFFETVVGRGQIILAETLKRVAGAKFANESLMEELADLLVGSLIGPQYFAALLGRSAVPTQAAVHARIDWLMDILAPALGLEVDVPSSDPDILH